MNSKQEIDSRDSRLPSEFFDRITRPVRRFLEIEAAAGFVLLVFTCLALGIANSPLGHQLAELWETPIGLRLGSFEFLRSLREWINDGLMTLFFFLVALELKRELVLGELRRPRAAALSISAAIGGMLVPATIYILLQFGDPGENGWGTVMATDTAFVIGCLALLGKRVPQSLRIFMLSLAIIDDIGAVLIVAIGYGASINWVMLPLALLGFAFVYGIAKLGIRSITLYFLFGLLIWLVIDSSGIHATITGVILGLMTPTRGWVSDKRLKAILSRVTSIPPGDQWSGNAEDRKKLRMAETATRETLSPVERLEMMLHPWVGFAILPLFAFANAGVTLSAASFGNAVTFAVFIGFAVGKPIGILSFAWLAVRMRLATLPSVLNWRLLAGGGMLAGIGFTMALFIANLAFSQDLIDSAKLGILASSVFSAAAGMLLLSLFSKSKS